MKSPHSINRRKFLRHYGIASSALTFSPFFVERMTQLCQASSRLVRVYKVKNGDCFQNIAKLLDMLGGVSRYIGRDDVVVIKANGQWPNQGYSHSGVIKALCDAILQIPAFSGEIIICDNVQVYGSSGAIGFDATLDKRVHNWPDHTWNSLAAQYQANGKPVATKQWVNGPWRNVNYPSYSVWNPADGEGWTRSFSDYQGMPTMLSYPVFPSPLTPNRMIDLKNGVWENGGYSGRRVRTIVVPTLNNHGTGSNEDVGITSAIKSFFGISEIPIGWSSIWNGYYHIHKSAYHATSFPQATGELVGRFLNTLFSPSLYITAAMWSGWYSRTADAAETKTVLACENPVTLDYVSGRDVISPYAAWLNPDQNNHTREQILGCNNAGIGTIDPSAFEIISYDFLNPTATRLDVERKIRDFKAGTATEQGVKDTIRLYMENR